MMRFLAHVTYMSRVMGSAVIANANSIGSGKAAHSQFYYMKAGFKGVKIL